MHRSSQIAVIVNLKESNTSRMPNVLKALRFGVLGVLRGPSHTDLLKNIHEQEELEEDVWVEKMRSMLGIIAAFLMVLTFVYRKA